MSVSLCVCVSVTTKGSTWYVYTLKVRYHRILHELLKSFDVWISLKVFSLKVIMVLFAYSSLQYIYAICIATCMPHPSISISCGSVLAINKYKASLACYIQHMCNIRIFSSTVPYHSGALLALGGCRALFRTLCIIAISCSPKFLDALSEFSYLLIFCQHYTLYNCHELNICKRTNNQVFFQSLYKSWSELSIYRVGQNSFQENYVPSSC